MAHIPSLTCGGDACGLEARLVVTSMVKKVQLTQNTLTTVSSTGQYEKKN